MTFSSQRFYSPGDRILHWPGNPPEKVHQKLTAEEAEPVLAAKLSRLQANLFLPILDKKKIPYDAQSNLGSGFTLRAGNILEELALIVRKKDLDVVLELLRAYQQDVTEDPENEFTKD